jgi:hypothetical protein
LQLVALEDHFRYVKMTELKCPATVCFVWGMVDEWFGEKSGLKEWIGTGNQVYSPIVL